MSNLVGNTDDKFSCLKKHMWIRGVGWGGGGGGLGVWVSPLDFQGYGPLNGKTLSDQPWTEAGPTLI